uniref:Uncharacterized protein n=1 Tax=Anguilla anguilla TaxID=7936 RepID=A0A0E9Q5Q8_ANGAN
MMQNKMNAGHSFLISHSCTVMGAFTNCIKDKAEDGNPGKPVGFCFQQPVQAQ